MDEAQWLEDARRSRVALEVPAAGAVRRLAGRRRAARRSAGAACLAVAGVILGVGLANADMGGSGRHDVADDAPAPMVDRVELTMLPAGWGVVSQSSDGASSSACLGRDGECAVRVYVASQPRVDGSLKWFGRLTEDCTSPATTDVVSIDIELPAGPGRKYSMQCSTLSGDITNSAWVLQAGVAILPATSAHETEAAMIAEAVRLPLDSSGPLPAETSSTPVPG